MLYRIWNNYLPLFVILGRNYDLSNLTGISNSNLLIYIFSMNLYMYHIHCNENTVDLFSGFYGVQSFVNAFKGKIRNFFWVLTEIMKQAFFFIVIN